MGVPKRSKSKERERKHLQRLNLSEENKQAKRNNDAKAKLENRKLETKEEKKERLEKHSAYKKARILVYNPEKLIGKRRKQMRLEKGIGVNDGKATTWISKSLGEMTKEENREYLAHMKIRSRLLETETKKEDLNQKDRREKYKRRFARYRQDRTKDLRDTDEDQNENEEDMLKRYVKWEKTEVKKYPFKLSKHEETALDKVRAGKSVQEDEESFDHSEEEDMEPYWMDYSSEDNERDGIVVFEKVKPGELDEESKAWDKQIKMIKKHEFQKPMPALIQREPCQYEKIRETII